MIKWSNPEGAGVLSLTPRRSSNGKQSLRSPPTTITNFTAYIYIYILSLVSRKTTLENKICFKTIGRVIFNRIKIDDMSEVLLKS